MSALNWSAVCGFKAKGQTGLAPTLRLLCPSHYFFIAFPARLGFLETRKALAATLLVDCCL